MLQVRCEIQCRGETVVGDTAIFVLERQKVTCRYSRFGVVCVDVATEVQHSEKLMSC